MEPNESVSGRARRLFNGIVLIAIVIMVGHAVVTATQRAAVRGDIRTAVYEAEQLRQALLKFHASNGEFPNSYLEPAFDLEKLEPLKRRGYYRGGLLAMVRNKRIDAYESPDDRGPNQEFWLEFSLARDPQVRVLIAQSDDAPLSGGQWSDGVYVYQDGTLERAE